MLSSKNVKDLASGFNCISASLTDSFCEKLNLLRIEKEIKESFLTDQFIKNANSYFLQIGQVKPELANYYKTESPNFNVFKILGLDRKEVITHTPFLAHLLSPVDSHHQSDLFLKSFLQEVLNFPNKDIEKQSWIVKKECGQVDIRIENPYLGKAVFIENKIDTGAHSGQLSRYFKFWKDNFRGGAFIYLTINGEYPSEQGFDELIYPKDEILSELMIISYKNDIYAWLESCFTNIQSNRVKYTIHQYLDLIKQL